MSAKRQPQSKNLQKPAKNRASRSKSEGRTDEVHETPAWKRLLLTLTLVPLAIGILLLIAWMLDLEIFGNPERLPPVASFFILLSFTASNLIQAHWLLATGWGLLSVASLLLWLSTSSTVLIASYILGGLGLILLGLQYFRRISQTSRGKNR